MKKNTRMQKKLQDILSQKSFEELEPFKNSTAWNTLAPGDRKALASLFVMQGEKQLEQGNKLYRESFELASNIASNDPAIFHRIGCAYAGCELNEEALMNAKSAFERSLKLDDTQFEAWIGLGNVHNDLAMINQDPAGFHEAVDCFQQALNSSKNESPETIAHLYGSWAITYYCIGKESGEAVDFCAAIEKFRLASEGGYQDQYFWNAFGDALAEFSCLIGKIEMFWEVVELYRQAIRISFDFFEGWLNLGCAFQRLYEYSADDELFNHAGECFKMASQIDPSKPLLWFKWAYLNVSASKFRRDFLLLQEAFPLYEKALELDPNDPLIMGLYGESLLLWGAYQEDVFILRTAREKIAASLKMDDQIPELWYIYGCASYELGRYFNHEAEFHNAIEIYQSGLALRDNDPLLWYGIANASYAIGDMNDDIRWIEKSIKLFEKVVELHEPAFKPLWNDWGVALLRLGEITDEKCHIEAAIEKFERIIPPNLEDWIDEYTDIEWLYNYGCALDFLGELTQEAGHFERAISALELILNFDPEHLFARYNLALALAHQGDLMMDVESFHKSIEQFQILLSKEPEDEMGWCDYGLTLIHLALLIKDPAQPEQEKTLFEIAESKLMRSLSLGYAPSAYNLACLHAMQNNLELAMHFLERAEATHSLPHLDAIRHDEWLDNLRNFPPFRLFVQRLITQHRPNSL